MITLMGLRCGTGHSYYHSYGTGDAALVTLMITLMGLVMRPALVTLTITLMGLRCSPEATTPDRRSS